MVAIWKRGCHHACTHGFRCSLGGANGARQVVVRSREAKGIAEYMYGFASCWFFINEAGCRLSQRSLDFRFDRGLSHAAEAEQILARPGLVPNLDYSSNSAERAPEVTMGYLAAKPLRHY